LQPGIDYYINDEGMFVFTEAFHLQRGFCCGRGCKHCPYDYINVPEIKRAFLLKTRKQDDEKDK